MAKQITLNLPDDISLRAQMIAEASAKAMEEVLIEHLQTLSVSILPDSVRAEIEALAYLSDDALWTIAREQIPSESQSRADVLIQLQTLSDEETDELTQLLDRADRVMLRKAEALSILKQRGFTVSQEDFLP